MRIVYLHQYFTTPTMSGGTRSYEMARRLVARGHTVHMLTADRAAKGGGWRETVEAGIRVHWCAVPYSSHMSYRRRLWAFLEYCRLAAKRASTLDTDVILASSTPLTIALPAAYAARRQGVPMVFEVRDLWPDTPIAVGALRSRFSIAAARRLERFAYRSAAQIIALSPDMKSGVVAQGYPSDRVTVIPNSSDVALFRVPLRSGYEFRRAQPWLGDRPLVVYTGALGVVNGVDYLARLAAEVIHTDPEIRFLVVGDGRQQQKVHQSATELGVLDRNFFLWPSLPKIDMPAVLSAADIATSTVIDRPALWANSANKVFDAFAAGRPVAINHQGWLADVIHQNGCGIVLDPRDLPSAARELTAAIRDQQWLAQAGAASRRLGETVFSRDRLAGMLEQVLEDAAGFEQKRQAA